MSYDVNMNKLQLVIYIDSLEMIVAMKHISTIYMYTIIHQNDYTDIGDQNDTYINSANILAHINNSFNMLEYYCTNTCSNFVST